MTAAARPGGQRVAYVRVSSAGQNMARQLEAVGECEQVFTEKQSGKNATDRPQLQALIRHVRRGDHVAWQKVVGGRIKSDLRFSATIVWNTFPLPDVSDSARDAIIAAGEGVLDTRALRPERSLAQHYNKLAMDPQLLKAHAALDRAVDKTFGSRKALFTDEDRQKVLFAHYAEMLGTSS